MDQTVLLWLFAGAFGSTAGCYGLVWRAISAASKASSDLAAYKLHVAEHFTSLTHAAALEHRTTDALGDIKTALQRQDAKLDRLMEGRSGGAS